MVVHPKTLTQTSMTNSGPSGGIGRRRGLKPPGSQDLTGSSPVSGTTINTHKKEIK